MKADKLDMIFEMQASLDDEIVRLRNLAGISKSEWIQKGVLATISELSEVLDEVNFKWWKNANPIDDDKLKDELVDVLHFFTGMCIRAGMDGNELFSRYAEKNRENFDRQYGKSEKPGYKTEA
ncbi:MAG: dUTPase [Clostridia bacterium]